MTLLRLGHLVGRDDADLGLPRGCAAARPRAVNGSVLALLLLSSGRLTHRNPLFVLDLALEDRLDTGDLAFRLDDFTGCFEPLGFALESEPEQVALDFLEQEIELFVGLLAKLAGFGHLLEAP